MLFASFTYILSFLPIVVLICIALQKFVSPKVAQVWVLAVSVFFYMTSNPFNLVFLTSSILANWSLVQAIEQANEVNKKRWMAGAVAANIAYLIAFKYLDFIASMVPFLLPHGWLLPHLPFPLGVSFFTLMQIMYVVDCYEGTLDAGSLLDHATFVSFFPYVISGPLARPKRLRHQFGHFGGVEGERAANISRGLFHFSMGLFKKAVFADSFARVANYGYTSGHHLSALEAWVFSVSYALQLYFDFSGYSDMAIGAAMMLGIEIPRNFDAPYSSTSIIEFWQRWHISLTQFITTYLFTPLLKALKKKAVFRRNLLPTSMLATVVAMVLAGVWHGAAWTYVVYGFMHGSYLAINQFWRRKQLPQIPSFIAWIFTFGAVLVSFIFFRASSVGEAVQRTRGLFNFHNLATLNNLSQMSIDGISLRIFGLPLLAGLIVAFFGRSAEQRAREFRPTLLNCFYTVVMTSTAFVFVNSSIPTPFVYFRF